MPFAPGQPVGRVAAQGDEVRHLRRRRCRSARCTLAGVDHLGAVPAAAADVQDASRARPTHWNMSRSPVNSSARAAGRRLGDGQRAEQVVGLERRRGRRRYQPNAAKNARRVVPLRRRGRPGIARAVGVVGRVAARRGTPPASAPKHRTTARGSWRSTARRIRLAEPEQRVDRPAVGPLDRVGQREEGAVQQRAARRRRAGGRPSSRGPWSTGIGLPAHAHHATESTTLDDEQGSARSSACPSGTRSPRRRSTRFADVTGDDQWIHLDVERAKETPFGGDDRPRLLHALPRPHVLLLRCSRVDGFAFGVNYGYGKVRFPAPLPVGSKVRMRRRRCCPSTTSPAACR